MRPIVRCCVYDSLFRGRTVPGTTCPRLLQRSSFLAHHEFLSTKGPCHTDLLYPSSLPSILSILLQHTISRFPALNYNLLSLLNMVSRPAPPAGAVALSFVSVCCRVEHIPARRPELYGERSMLSHGSFCATGSERISGIVHDFALSGVHTELLSTDLQRCKCGYVVPVQGMVGGKSLFYKVFVLERVGNSEEEHFLLLNNVFCFVQEDKEAAAQACKILPLGTFLEPNEGRDLASALSSSECDADTGYPSLSSFEVGGGGVFGRQEIVSKRNEPVSRDDYLCESPNMKKCGSVGSQCSDEVPCGQGCPELGLQNNSLEAFDEALHSTTYLRKNLLC